jgi:hypothetical protein
LMKSVLISRSLKYQNLVHPEETLTVSINVSSGAENSW